MNEKIKYWLDLSDEAMLDKETVINTVKQYADVVVRELSPAAVVLFGSYAKGNAHDDSDIDVAAIFDGFTGDWLKTSSTLWRLRRNISLYIEPVLLDSTEDKSGFVKNIYKTGQIIYNSKAN
ncbi:MAG: nucleotidyltransferase domain-containing protein [Spirochaetes bacterium]|nr:nucleotidyltransferase domain-containing protein [Spirochaetota bacterium]